MKRWRVACWTRSGRRRRSRRAVAAGEVEGEGEGSLLRGQKKNINGFDTREVITTITVREKGKSLEEGGGVVLTADSWLGPAMPVMKEIAEFDQRYWKAIGGPEFTAAEQQQMAAAVAMYPALKDAMVKYQSNNVNTEGTAILTTVTFDGVKSQEQAAQESKPESSQEEARPSGIGGMLGGFGRRMAKKKSEDSESSKAQGQNPNRATIMTMNHEVLSVATSVAAPDVAIPAGYRQK